MIGNKSHNYARKKINMICNNYIYSEPLKKIPKFHFHSFNFFSAFEKILINTLKNK